MENSSPDTLIKDILTCIEKADWISLLYKLCQWSLSDLLLKECGYTYTAKDIEGLKRIVEKVVVVVFPSFTRFCDSIGLRRKESNINSIFWLLIKM